MNFIVIGCGRVGAELSYRLYKNGHQVVVVDSNKDAFNRIHSDFHGRTVEGEALSADTCLLYTSPSPRDRTRSRMPSSA